MVGGLPSSNLWNIEYEDLIFKNIIGKGNFGCVYRGEYLGVDVAIKQIPSYDDPDYCKYTEREVKALRYIRHPLIVHFFGCCQHSSGFYLVTEFIDGMDLRRFIKSIPKPPSWLSRVNIALGVAKTFLFLHSKNILHRDLKSKNILLDVTRNQIKLCDFGFARIGSQYSNGSDSSSSDDDENNNNNQHGEINNAGDEVYKFNGNGKNANYRLRRMSVCGTPSFMAPEILLQQKYDWTIDVFSFGILLSELITMKRPGKDYWVRSQNNGFDINVDELNANIPSPNDCPVQFYDLALMCCSYKHKSRPKFSTIIHILESIKDTLESNNLKQPITSTTTTTTTSIKTSNQFLQLPTLSQQISNSIDSNNNNSSIMTNSNNSLISQNQKSIINNHNNHKNQTGSIDSITTNPISIFKERKKPQSFNKLLKVNTSTLIDHESSSNGINSTSNTGLLSIEREGVIKLNQSKYTNGWKEFGIDSATSKIWIIYQSNIIKISSNNNNTNSNNNLIEITCGTIVKLKKHSITISITDSNLINGINIINVKSYLKDYPHISTPIKSNNGNSNGKQLKSNGGKSGYDIKSIIKIQSIVRCWLVKRRFKSFNSNWKLTNSNNVAVNKRQWITLFNQLINSELEYKIQLDHVIKSYLLPLQSKFRINKPLINYKEIGSIFSNIESLSEIQNELLKIVNQISKSPYFIINFENEQQQQHGNGGSGDLSDEYFTNVSINTKNSSNQINSISQFIVKNISQIKNQYGIFAFNFKYSTNIFNWCKLNPDFSNFIESIRVQLNQQYPDQENDLSSLLSLPINKIQKYLLIFEKLAQITPIAHSEYKDIKAAFTLIKETSNYIQSQLEMSFEHSHIMSIDVMLQKKDNQSLVQSGRWFIKQGLFDNCNGSSGNNNNNGISSGNGKQYYLFLLSDILLITKPIKSKSKSTTSSSSSTMKKELNLSNSFQNLSHAHNNNNNSTNTTTTPVVNNLKYYYRLRKTINLKEEEVIMRINPEVPNGVIFTTCSTNKSYKWILQSEDDAKDWVNEFERITVILSGIKSSSYGTGGGNGSNQQQQSTLSSSQSNLGDLNEVNQIHQINQSNSNANGGINNSSERGFIKRFRLSFSSGSDSSRKASLANITNTSSLNNLGDCNGASGSNGSASGSNNSSSNNTPTTPIKSVLSSPSIHYTPASNNNNNSTPIISNNDQQQPEFQFLVPTTPASEKKKKRKSFSSKLKRLSVTFSPNDHKKNNSNKEQQQEN